MMAVAKPRYFWGIVWGKELAYTDIAHALFHIAVHFDLVECPWGTTFCNFLMCFVCVCNGASREQSLFEPFTANTNNTHLQH